MAKISNIERIKGIAYETFLQNLRDQQHGKGLARRSDDDVPAAACARREDGEGAFSRDREGRLCIHLPSLFGAANGRTPSLPPIPHYD